MLPMDNRPTDDKRTLGQLGLGRHLIGGQPATLGRKTLHERSEISELQEEILEGSTKASTAGDHKVLGQLGLGRHLVGGQPAALGRKTLMESEMRELQNDINHPDIALPASTGSHHVQHPPDAIADSGESHRQQSGEVQPSKKSPSGIHGKVRQPGFGRPPSQPPSSGWTQLNSQDESHPKTTWHTVSEEESRDVNITINTGSGRIVGIILGLVVVAIATAACFFVHRHLTQVPEVPWYQKNTTLSALAVLSALSMAAIAFWKRNRSVEASRPADPKKA
jgi:hypothetical protein